MAAIVQPATLSDFRILVRGSADAIAPTPNAIAPNASNTARPRKVSLSARSPGRTRPGTINAQHAAERMLAMESQRLNSCHLIAFSHPHCNSASIVDEHRGKQKQCEPHEDSGAGKQRAATLVSALCNDQREHAKNKRRNQQNGRGVGEAIANEHLITPKPARNPELKKHSYADNAH